MTDGPRRYQTFFAELKRRHVFKVAAVYGVVAFAVMQAADFLVPALRLPDAVASAIALLAILGFPIAVVLAWAFEVTPEGVRRAAAAKGGELEAIVERPRGQRWPAGILALVGIALLVGGGWWVLGRDAGVAAESEAEEAPAAAPNDSGRTRLVVLPFENLGPTAHEYFADGITDEITSRLAAIGALGIISRTSAIQYKDTDKSLQQIGAELDVDYVLEGTILWQQRPDAPSRVRVTPQLIRVSDDTHVWADRYDAVMADIFQVQSTIARQVIDALNVALLESDRRRLEARPTDNLEAYDYYLRGNNYYERGVGPGNLQTALRQYERAVELDPDFAAAWARLAQMHLRYYWFGYGDAQEEIARAKSAADRALELAPDLPEPHIAQGFYHYWARLDYERALEEFDIAREMQPNDADLLSGIAYVQRRMGDWDASLAALDRALELSPRNYQYTWNQAFTYYFLRRYPESERLLDRAISLAPDATDAYVNKASLLVSWHGGGTELRELLRTVRAVSDIDLFLAQAISLGSGATIFRIEPEYTAALQELAIDDFRGIDHDYYLSRTGYYGATPAPAVERAYYDSARAVLEGADGDTPREVTARAQLGVAYAGLGRRNDAVRTGRAAAEELSVQRNALEGVLVAYTLAEIYVMVGDHEEAIEVLERLLSIPSPVSAAQLRADPLWDPIRDQPRFQALLAAN